MVANLIPNETKFNELFRYILALIGSRDWLRTKKFITVLSTPPYSMVKIDFGVVQNFGNRSKI